MFASLLTGLRISVDGMGNTWAQAIEPVLPQGEIWTWHLLAGLVLFFCTVAYGVYLHRAALTERNAPSRMRTLKPPTTKKLRLKAMNVALHWFAYGAILALTVSGVLLYWGYGGLFVTIHKALAWTMLFYVFIHTLAHFLYGGIDQLMRLFRPAPLSQTRLARTWPTAIALSTGLGLAAGAYALDKASKPHLPVNGVDAVPVLDGVLDDEIWHTAPVATMRTQQGANLGGTGTSTVQIQSVRSENHIHFAFRWEDPTRSLLRSPTIKRSDGWHVLATGAGEADVNDYYEDKFAVLFSHADMPGGAGATYMGPDPLPAFPKSPHERGLHYTDDGRVLDLWQWKSSRGGMLGHVDDMHIGPPKAPGEDQASGKKRYAAGYDADPGKAIYEYNYIADGPDGYAGPVRLKRLPRDLAQFQKNLGTIPATADDPSDAGSQWWMTAADSVTYDPALDATIPVGTLLPSTLNIHEYSGDRADLQGGARWQDGHWTLEVTRALNTGSPYDIVFQPGTRVYLWVSVFDHNQTRHTRHQRPIVLDIGS